MKAARYGKRASATGTALLEMLSTKPKYVRLWRMYSDRQRGPVNQRAIAKVIALYLWDQGVRPDTDVDLPLTIKNLVNRALLGQRLTAQTLQYFIDAFDMDHDDRLELWRLFAGSDGVAQTIDSPRALARRQWHRTVALFENYYIDSAHFLYMRRTVQCIEAKEDDVDMYLLNHEPWVSEIDVVQGGRLGRRYEYGDGLVAHDIVLERPLSQGERVPLEYVCRYRRGNQVAEVRRPARGRSSNISLLVHFSPSALPSRVWSSVWSDHLVGGVVSEHRVAIPSAGVVHVCLPFMEQTVVGFRWEW